MCVLANKISKLAFGQEKQLSSLEGQTSESSKNIECNPDGILEGSFVASISLQVTMLLANCELFGSLPLDC